MVTCDVVSENALVARINRRIESDGLRLKRCAERSRAFSSVGRFHVIDVDRGAIVRDHVEIEDYGREVGALAKFESLERAS